MLKPRKCYFILLGIKENEQLDLMCNDITLKHSSHKRILGVTTDNKPSFAEHSNNICKRTNKKLNALSRINKYMKQNQKEIFSSSFIISHSSYCRLIWIICSKNQQCINFLMIKVYKYLNGHSSDIMSDIFKLKEKMYNLQNFPIFQAENPCSLKYRLDVTPSRANLL